MTETMTSSVDTRIVIKNVHDYLELPKLGRVYRGLITVALLARLLRKSTVRYAPQYQRGFKKQSDDPSIFNVLLPLTDAKLQVNRQRAEEMAVKYLQGELFSATMIWNARRDSDEPAPVYDQKEKTLSLFGDIVVPDTAHRHLFGFFLAEWKRDARTIPSRVTVNDVPVTRETIVELLADFDPNKANLFLEIYNLTPEKEGWLYDQFNFDSRPPQKAVGNTLNPMKTPGRRFVLGGLMRTSKIFAETEVEMRQNNIGSDSRKLVTNNTLIGAADSFKKLLVQVENENGKTGARDDLLAFFDAFFTEYGKHFPEVLPTATRDERQKLRQTSFAISNVMFHPLFRLAKDLWEAYRNSGRDWRKADEWRDYIARIAGKTKVDGRTYKVMDRANPQWVGNIVIVKYGPNGPEGTSVSNTTQTRLAAYKYLVEVAKARDFLGTTAAP